MKIHPLGERVLIKSLKREEKTSSGLYLPKGTEERKEGEVVEVGSFQDGKPLPLQKGEKVIYGGYSKEEIETDGENYYIVDFKDILARIE